MKVNKLKMISFSGIDGSGKGTQIGLLEEYFAKNNIKYKTIWARGSWTPGIELVKKIVRKDRKFSEEQKKKYRREARTNLKKQKIILILSILDFYWFFGIYYRIVCMLSTVLICDRYIWDTVVDFRVNFEHYRFEEWLLWKTLIKLIPYPYPSFLFAMPAEQSLERDFKKQEVHMESLEVKLKKVEEYRNLIGKEKWTNVIDGMLPVDVIHKNILEVLVLENR